MYDRERNGSVVECLTRNLEGPRVRPHRRHCVVSLSKNINNSLILARHRKTHPFVTEKLLMGRKESNYSKTMFGQPDGIFVYIAYMYMC